MYKLSDIVSKQVISLRGALFLGTVADVLFSPALKKADSLLLIDAEENAEHFLKLPVSAISRVGEHAVTVTALSRPLEACDVPHNNPVHRQCFGVSGKLLGPLTDIETDEKFNVTAFTVGSESYPPDKLVSLSDALAVFNDTDAPVKLPKVRIRRPKSTKKTIVTVTAKSDMPAQAEPAKVVGANIEEKTAQDAVTATAEIKDKSAEETDSGFNAAVSSEINAPVTTPTGAVAEKEYDTFAVGTPATAGETPPPFGAPDYSFLIGSRLSRPLCDSSGKVIALENATVTREVIAAAALAGKLVQLALRAVK